MSADIIDHPSGRRRTGEHAGAEKSPARYWLKHDVKAFAFETATVDAEGAGALILLRGRYYITGCLPKTDAECAKVCRLSARKFARLREWLFSFFPNGKSAELDASIEETERIIANRRDAGRRGGVGKALASARQNSGQLQSQSELQKEKPSSSSSEEPSPSPAPNSEPRAREATEIAAECLAVMPISMKADPRMRGFTAWIARLHSDGVDKAAIIEGVTRSVPSLDGPPSTFEYFRPAIDRAAAAHCRARPVSNGESVSLEGFERHIANELQIRRADLIAHVGADRLATLHGEFTTGKIGMDQVITDFRAANWMRGPGA